jgi:ribosomal protein L11 methyltransferase
VPYRVDVVDARADADGALDRLVELGALDIERVSPRGIAALMPDSITPDEIAQALGDRSISVSPAVGRDADSVWVLSPRPIRVGRVRIVPAHRDSEPGAIMLIDGPAFGTGLHPTTALCLEALDEALQIAIPEAVLDVGSGSGVLALAALVLGVPRAIGVDLAEAALEVAKHNADINGLGTRLHLVCGGPDVIAACFPLVLANVLAAPLIDMAPQLVRRVGHQGRLVLSGIPCGIEAEVDRTYRRLGMRRVDERSRAGWVGLVLEASW